MNKVSISMVLFISFCVGFTVFLTEYLLPDSSRMVSVTIAGFAALVSGLASVKLFPRQS
jgi:hypothetical protein